MSESTQNIRLGIFVIAGSVLLILALYLIGSKQNLFGSTFSISAEFRNVNGLMQGNNVRFAGIDVGTVESVDIISDSSVRVLMVIENTVQPYIKKNAVAAVGTDGLMGNKLININSVNKPAPSVEEGDTLHTLKPIEMDEMIRTLNATNENIRVITDNLRSISEKFNNKNSLWSVLLDTNIADHVKSTLVNIELMSDNGLRISGDLRQLAASLKSGKGSIGALITDTTLSHQVHQTIITLNKVSDSAAVLTGDVASLVKDLKSGKGSVGVLLQDTSMVHELNKTLKNLEKGSSKFDLNMEAVKESWPFRKYFRKLEKKKKKKNEK